jgi:gliding motility-associated-like protein
MYGITTTVTGVANGQAKVTWNRFPLTDSLARGYVVYHSTTGVWPYTPIAYIYRPNDTFYVHNNINTSDSTHYYTVKVIDTCGAQSDSAAPFRTINLNLTIGNGAMVLDWLPVLNDTVSGYEIEKSSNGLPLVPITILSSSTTQYIDSAVSCGTRYSYRVKGLYSLKPNFTTFSDSVSGISIDTIPPDISVVEKASVTVPNRNGQIELSFYSPTQQNRSGYNLYRKSANGAWGLLRTFNTTAFGLITTTDFGVNTLDSTYQYRISSLDSCGNESQYGEIHSPSNISVTAVSQANNISWTAYQGFDSLIYRIERSINGGNFQFLYDIQSTSFADSSIKCDTLYTYRVKVYDIQNPMVVSLSDTATVIGIDLTAPNVPVLGVVSVTNTNPFGGTVQINFTPSSSSDVRHHIIERRSVNTSNWTVRARIPAGGPTVFNDFGNTSDSIFVYRIYAVDTCGNVSNFSAEHAFVHLETTPLNEAMQLNWSRYVGMIVGKYDVVRDGIVIASFLGGNDTSMVDTQLICTQIYQYFIRTYSIDQLTTSLSNVENNSPFDTSAPLNTYLQVASVQRGDVSNKITFRASSSFDVRTYQVWRRTNGTNAPLVVYQTNTPIIGFTTIVDSLNIKSDAEFYCYSIVAFDYCGNQSPESNLGCTMLAKASYSTLKSTITWTPYSQWWTGVDHYEVERTTDGTNWIQVANVASGVNKFIDEDLPANSGQLCYRVLAIEPAGNFNEKSYSNTVCVTPEPIVNIPTAFSPGTSAGLNDFFGPVAAFYDQFELTIFNRWGEKIFDGKSKNDLWDGKQKGELVPTGIYVYQLIVYDFNGKPYRFQGTVSVVR